MGPRGPHTDESAEPLRARLGRRPATTRAALEAAALVLFTERGFDNTSVEEIAAAAGIARRTVFRYCGSKTDLVWGDFATGLDAMARQLDATDPDVAVTQAIRLAVVDFNRLPPEQVPLHRQRMTLILRVPTLLANSTLHFAQWRQVVAEFAARRMDVPPHGLLPRTIAHCALGAAVAAYECWLDDPAADLAVLLDEALRELASGFAERGQLR
ncbi:MAG: mycofactocin system transcriptional regulator [Actinomycetota bacterium]|nr:mycofactocin system transcriptional regulator [Actinomycetota bacterium]